ncbi:hypothetical protein [Azospirillum sp. TSA2s]|uniref:hypothetical protein n=1 Tax=Azospirillum sp. TSA2s TaxID=709810 RepID=UPI00145A4062|nr:hypothetical protein [Azospirillum sp. TSA2s]
MAIMRKPGQVSDNIVTDNNGRDIESRDIAKRDNMQPKYVGDATKFINYGDKTANRG